MGDVRWKRACSRWCRIHHDEAHPTGRATCGGCHPSQMAADLGCMCRECAWVDGEHAEDCGFNDEVRRLHAEARLEASEAMVVALIEDVAARDRRIEELSERMGANSRADGRVFGAVLDLARAGVGDPEAQLEAAAAVVRAACRRFCDHPPAIPAGEVLADVGADGKSADVGLSRAERVAPGLYDVELSVPVEGPVRVDVGALAILGVSGEVSEVEGAGRRWFRVEVTDGHTGRPVDGSFVLRRGDGPDEEAARYVAAVGPVGRHDPAPAAGTRRLRIEVVPRTSEGFGWGEVREFSVPGGAPVRVAILRGDPDGAVELGANLLDEVSGLGCRVAVILPRGTELEVAEIVPA